GRPAESLHYQTIVARVGAIAGPMADRRGGPGGGTDDSALKHLLCAAILRADSEVTARDWALVWREQMDPRHYWVPIQNAYYRLMLQHVPPDEIGVGTMVSNSSAMCIAPVGIVNAGNPAAAAREAMSVARLIHRGTPLEAAGAVAAAVAAALAPNATPETAIAAAGNHLPPDSEMLPAIAAGVALARSSDSYEAFREAFYQQRLRPWPSRDDQTSTAVDPRESVPAALGILLLADGDPVTTILGCANFGRDADTIATIGGAIAGGLRGASALPADWVAAVQAATPVDQEELASSLVAVLNRRARQAAVWGAQIAEQLA
ncbi:MAG TPA: ADP-ribosylglycohydrolase family protein, partial [Thermomicrobiales bacterium]|nr:ADP-ribosylglycohydrolase family protein [Thermomicrobiales bacterium]